MDKLTIGLGVCLLIVIILLVVYYSKYESGLSDIQICKLALDEAHKNVVIAEKALADAKIQTDQIQSELIQSHNESQSYKDQIVELQNKLDSSIQIQTQAQNDLIVANNQLAKAGQDLQRAVDGCDIQTTKLNQSLSDVQGQLSTCTQNLKDTTAIKTQSLSSIQTLTTQLATANSTIATNKQIQADLQAKIDAGNLNITQLNKSITDANNQLATYKSGQITSQTSLTNMTNQYNTAQAQVVAVTSQLTNLKNAQVDLQAKLDAANANTQSATMSMGGQITALQSQLDNVNAMYKQSQSDLQTANNNIVTMRQKIADTIDQRNTCNSGKTQVEKNIADLNIDLYKASTQMKADAATIIQLQQIITDAKNTIQTLTNQLASSKQDLAAANNNIQQLQAIINQKSQDFALFQRQLTAKQSELDTANTSLLQANAGLVACKASLAAPSIVNAAQTLALSLANSQVTTLTNKVAYQAATLATYPKVNTCNSGTINGGSAPGCPNLSSDHCVTKLEENGTLSIYSKGVNIWSTKITTADTPVTSVMQPDGNYVIYNNKGVAIWASNTNGQGTGPYKLTLQDDCNMVLYDITNKPTWTSQTNGK